MAKLAQTSLNYVFHIDKNYRKEYNRVWDKLLATSNAVDLSKTLVGVIYSDGVADGYANYVVIKDKPLTLQHIHIGDGYQLPYPYIRGLNEKDIKRHAESSRKLKAMFS